MSSLPLISIVIPTYNRPNHVNRAIKSVLDQTYTNCEILVIDDASDYDIESELVQDDRIHLYRNKKNKGPCYSRNKGIRKARGEFINFLDDDDILYPTKLEKQIKVFNESEDPKLGMVTCHALDQRSGERVVKYNHVKGNIYLLMLSRYAVSGTETILFKTAYVKEVGGFDIGLASSQEYDLLIRLSEFYSINYVDEVLTEEFRSVNQISINFDKKISGASYLFSKHAERFRRIGLLFYMKMQVKLCLLKIRFYIGKYFGEKAYRLFLS